MEGAKETKITSKMVLYQPANLTLDLKLASNVKRLQHKSIKIYLNNKERPQKLLEHPLSLSILIFSPIWHRHSSLRVC